MKANGGRDGRTNRDMGTLWRQKRAGGKIENRKWPDRRNNKIRARKEKRRKKGRGRRSARRSDETRRHAKTDGEKEEGLDSRRDRTTRDDNMLEARARMKDVGLPHPGGRGPSGSFSTDIMEAWRRTTTATRSSIETQAFDNKTLKTHFSSSVYTLHLYWALEINQEVITPPDKIILEFVKTPIT